MRMSSQTNKRILWLERGYISPENRRPSQGVDSNQLQLLQLLNTIMLSTHQWLLVSIATLVAWLIGRYLFSTQRPTDFPPGPATIFGLGNLHQIPIKQPYLQFHKWTGTYGDIIGLKVGPANLVVLNSSECVRELFDKRGAIYSGRPYSYIPSKHVFREHRDKHILTLQNGPYLRQFRTAVSYLVGPTGLKQTLPMQEATAATLVWKLSVTPSNFQEHLRHWALATPLLTIAGQRLEDRGKAFSDRFFDAQRKWLEILEPGSAPPVDFIPFLRWVPEMFAGWKTKARCVRKYMLDEYFSFLESAERLRSSAEKDENAGQNGAKFLCLLAKVLEEDDNENPGRKRFTADQVAYMGGGLVDAAVDTTWATLMSFIMFMAVYPDCQAKARAEIDQLSVDQPPRGDIIGQIPYVRACILEVSKFGPDALGPYHESDTAFHPRHSVCVHRLPAGCPTSSTAMTPSRATKFRRGLLSSPTSGRFSATRRSMTSRKTSSQRGSCTSHKE